MKEFSSSRKYIDLIHLASSKWANWDPPNPIKVGDYGTVDKETGLFEKEGNIYHAVETAQIAAPHLPQTATPEDVWIISSFGVKRRDLQLEAELGVAGLGNASIKGRWEFGSNRGALLIMARPQISHIPPKVFLKLLIDVPALKDKSLVTEIVSCPAYSQYLSTANKDVVDVALVGTVPVSPTNAAGGGVGASWWSQSGTGTCRHACDNSGSCSFTPLYTLKRIRKKKSILRRESPVPDPEDDDLWVDLQVPWDALDEDGDEIEFEDTVFD